MIRRTMRTKRLAVAVAVCILAASGSAFADPGIGAHRNLIISADRLFGFSYNQFNTEFTSGSTTVESSQTRTDFGLFTGLSGTGTTVSTGAGGYALPNVYMVPRVALDFAVANAFTVGGSAGFVLGSLSNSSTVNGVTSERDGPTATGILLAPRAGWTHGFGGRAGAWLRGGMTYYRVSSSIDTGTTETTFAVWGFSLNIEPTLTVSIVPGFGFTAGLVLDVPLTGGVESETTTGSTTTSRSIDSTHLNIGIVVGMLGWF